MKDQKNRDLREYVLKWLVAEEVEGRAKATAIDLHNNRFRTLLQALHGPGRSTAPSRRSEGGGGGDDRGEPVRVVIGSQGPLK